MQIMFNFFNNMIKIIGVFINTFYINNNEIFFIVKKKYFINFIYFFKKHQLLKMEQLIDIVAVDFVKKENRFMLVYHFLSMRYNVRYNVMLYLSEYSPAYSISSLYTSAVWAEREIWDLFGVFFINNKDLRRILTDYGFSGFPMRKDFPVSGFSELFYDDGSKRLYYNDINLIISKFQRY